MAYLSSLGRDTFPERWQTRAAWPSSPLPAGDGVRGGRLFATWCAACHGPHGRGDGALAAALDRPRLDLAVSPLAATPAGPDPATFPGGTAGEEARRELARLVRFGSPGTPMPGHEWLGDDEVADLVAWLGETFGKAGGEVARATGGEVGAAPFHRPSRSAGPGVEARGRPAGAADGGGTPAGRAVTGSGARP